MAAWVLTAGLALVVTAGCNGLNLRGRDTPRLASPEQVERIQQISERAQAAIDRGAYEQARADLVELVAQEPESPEALQRLGTVLMLEGRLAEAEGCFHAALARDHDYVEAILGLGQVEAQRGDAATALKRFEMAISIDPRRPRAHYLLGRAREAVGQADEALAAYFRAVEFDANDVPSIVRISAIQLARNHPDQALSRLDQAVELAPADAEARTLRGLAHWKLHHISEAIADLRAAAQRLPDRPDIYYHLALALEADHKQADAQSAADQALRLAPTNSAVRQLSERLRR
jgi:tetratricopeptide (TPR) repeat protein